MGRSGWELRGELGVRREDGGKEDVLWRWGDAGGRQEVIADEIPGGMRIGMAIDDREEPEEAGRRWLEIVSGVFQPGDSLGSQRRVDAFFTIVRKRVWCPATSPTSTTSDRRLGGNSAGLYQGRHIVTPSHLLELKHPAMMSFTEIGGKYAWPPGGFRYPFLQIYQHFRLPKSLLYRALRGFHGVRIWSCPQHTLDDDTICSIILGEEVQPRLWTIRCQSSYYLSR